MRAKPRGTEEARSLCQDRYKATRLSDEARCWPCAVRVPSDGKTVCSDQEFSKHVAGKQPGAFLDWTARRTPPGKRGKTPARTYRRFGSVWVWTRRRGVNCVSDLLGSCSDGRWKSRTALTAMRSHERNRRYHSASRARELFRRSAEGCDRRFRPVTSEAIGNVGNEKRPNLRCIWVPQHPEITTWQRPLRRVSNIQNPNGDPLPQQILRTKAP